MENFEKIKKQVYNNLNTLGITVYNEDGTDRSLLDVLDEIAEKWDEMK